FQTNGADVELVKHIDKLLKDGRPSTGAKDLARVYMMILAAGFQGKFREPKLMRPIAEYRRRLYEFIQNDDPWMLYAEDRRIFPEALAYTEVGRTASRFSPLQRWAAILILTLLSYTAI